MISTAWLRRRRALWERLDERVRETGEHGLRALEATELRELALLYRQAAADLATVRADASSPQLAAYLNQLLGRAHNLVYRTPRAQRGGWLRFLTHGFPTEVRAARLHIAAAVAVFALFGLAAWVAATLDDGLVRLFLNAGMRDTIDHHRMWTDSILGMQPAAASGIMTNNITVALLMFGSGMSAGLYTAYLLALNGVLIGVIGAACHAAGMDVSLWSFVAPHGALELPTIFIAGGAAFVVAQALLFPGLDSRRVALERAGRHAVRLALGCVPLLVVAGLIEGFVSPSELAAPAKFALGALNLTLLVTWLERGGRGATDDSAPSPADSR